MPTPRSSARARSHQPRRQPWWFDTPSRPTRFALLLCGRIGPLRLSPSKALFAKRPALPSHALIQLASAAHHAQIIHPNLASGGCDVFIHTWNPQEAELIDGLYRASGALRRSRHEPATQLPKAASHALSVGRAAELAAAHEVAHNHTYTLALVLRLDAVPLEPLLLRDLSAPGLWFARGCCASRADTPEQHQLVQRSCGHGVSEREGGPRKRVVAACRIDHFWKADARRDPDDELGYYVHDSWFAAPVSVALTWGRIARAYAWYVNRARTLHISSSNPKAGDFLWSHQVWAIHVHDAINATPVLRFRRWQVALGRYVLRPALMASPGQIDFGDGACSDQAFAPDVLSSVGESLMPQAGLSARASAMAGACPEAHWGSKPIACCGQLTFHRRTCGGSHGQHESACVGAWRGLQVALARVNRTELFDDSEVWDFVKREPHKFNKPLEVLRVRSFITGAATL